MARVTVRTAQLSMKPPSPLLPHQKGVVGGSQPREDVPASLKRQRLQACGLVMSVGIAKGEWDHERVREEERLHVWEIHSR